jgi:hypothetical protein
MALLLAILLRKGCPDLPRRYRDILLSRWSILLTVLLSAAAVYYVKHTIATSDVSVEVDMTVSRGTLVELFVNDLSLPAYRQQAYLGQRHLYRFEKLPHFLTLLRLDPSEQADARVEIYSITVKSGDWIVKQFGPPGLKDWTLNNLSAPKEDAGSLIMTSTTDDPILWSPMAIQLPGAMVSRLAPVLDLSDGPFLLIMAAFFAVVLCRTATRPGRLQALQIALVCCVGFPVVLAVKHLDLQPPPVTATVGYANYNGYSKTNEILAAFLTMLIAVGLGYAFAKWAGRRGDGETEPEPAGPASRHRYVWLSYALVFAFFCFYFLPDFLMLFQSLKQTTYHNDSWDAANFQLWSALVNWGYRPYRDFWYPYGGFYTQFLRFPAGHLMTILHVSVVLTFYFLALVRITGRRLLQSFVVFGMLAIPLLLGSMAGWHRYLMPVVVVMLYAAICEVRRLEWRTHLPFAALAGYVCFSEPPQIVCATAGILVHTGLQAFAQFRGKSLRQRAMASLAVLKQRVVCVGIPMLAGVAGAALIYASGGMLSGLWDFEKSITDQGDYGALPAELGAWLLPALQPDTVFLLLFLLASYAAYRWVRIKGKSDPLGTALLVIAAAGYVAMQKQIIRPHVMTQIRVYPYAAALIFGLIVWRECRPAARLTIALFVGSILGIGVYHNLVNAVYELEGWSLPARVVSLSKILSLDAKQLDQVNDSLFDRSRFIGFDQQMAVVDNLRGDCGLKSGDSIYVLGDDSLFYILLKQAPPYVSNSYNDSPIYEQERVLEWLRRKNPRFVVWGAAAPDALIFDSVPHVVRLPLVYDYMVENYGLLRTVGTYRILTKLEPNQRPDVEFWRKGLGSRIDLGRIPRRARLTEYAPCEGDKSRCDAVLVVRYPEPAPVSRGKMGVVVQSAGDPFEIQFDVAPGQREYVVNLNRIWFWNALGRSGVPKLAAQDPRAQAFLGYRRERSPVLY